MSIVDMTEYDLPSAEEPKAAKAGTEYKLRILSVDKDVDKNGLDYLMPRLEIVDEPTSKDFTYFMHLPNREKMNAKQLTRAKWNLKTFCECFSIPMDQPVDPEDDWPGEEGWAVLGMKEDEQYGEQNFIKKFITPK